MAEPRVKRLRIPWRDRLSLRRWIEPLSFSISMVDFSGRHVSIRAGTAGQVVGDLIIDARTECRINLGTAEAAVAAAKFLAGSLRKVEGVDFDLVQSTVCSASRSPRHRAYRASWDEGWTYDADAPNHVPGRMFGDDRFEALSEEDLRAKDWVIEVGK